MVIGDGEQIINIQGDIHGLLLDYVFGFPSRIVDLGLIVVSQTKNFRNICYA
jgi:hypothetical protein